ncbi:uncharacterized protein wu:fb55g09 [Oryzias melastigma]|uniref:Uncharacterized protein n=1 Tax=Oryzias melastigma TaxID=30732 RepID=A0A3B3D131_ORYME|nr:uncharacterized protein wu:fb55g09 [Oryzias melastigma]
MLSEIVCRRSFQLQKQRDEEAEAREAAARRTRGCSKGCSARRAAGGGRGRQLRHHPRRAHPRTVSLRPVNVKGNRARGMRAPKNTNQFLMGEKYQMQHMRSDSVGSDCGCSSDSDAELTDMDSYLGALENARGALPDSPNPHGSTTPPGRLVVLHQGGERVGLEEDSMQYFPSEHDLLQSQNFMQKDFAEFCHFLCA